MAASERVASNAEILLIFGGGALVIALAVIPYAFFSHRALASFSSDGVRVTATVIDKGRELRPIVTRFARPVTQYDVDVAFVTGEGESVHATINRYISGPLWTSIDQGDRVDVYYRPDAPEQVVLVESLDKAWFPPVLRYEFGLGLLLIAVLLLWWRSRILAR